MCEGSTHLFDRLRGVELRAQQQAVGLLDGFDALGRKSVALEADRVDAVAARLARRTTIENGGTSCVITVPAPM